MVIAPYLRAIPLATPISLGAAVFFAVSVSMWARWLGASRPAAWVYCCAVVGFLAFTVTPSSGALAGEQQGSTGFSLHVDWATIRDLTRSSDASLNLLLGVALGVATAGICAGQTRYWPWLVAVALPIVAELTQWILPQLGRSGFLLTDPVNNLLGVALEAGAGLLLTRGWRSRPWGSARSAE